MNRERKLAQAGDDTGYHTSPLLHHVPMSEILAWAANGEPTP